MGALQGTAAGKLGRVLARVRAAPPPDRGLVFLLRLALTLLVGFGGGLALSIWALRGNLRFDEIRNGIWTAWLQPAGARFDPYSRAAFARSGEVPLTLGEGIMLVARADSAGRPLDRRCRYLFSGTVPPARLWTLTANAPSGYALEADSTLAQDQRRHLTSSEALREPDGSTLIRLGSEAMAGNWLPLSGSGPFLLVLRLYDTPLSASTRSVALTRLPGLERGACR